MTVQIIQFPRKTPLERHELPAHWSEYLKGYYVHVTLDGYNSHEDAFSYCENMAAQPPQAKGESRTDYLLRMARAELSS